MSKGDSREKIGYCNPPKEHRYSKTNPPPASRHKKHPNGYLTPLLRKLLEKKINYQDPETHKIINGKVKDAVLWRLILNASEGETQAIREVLDRIDGKVKDKTEHSLDDDLKGLLGKALSRMTQNG